jgi:suppressor for copper-sensitivity B
MVATACIWGSIALAVGLAVGATGANASTDQIEPSSLIGWVPFDRQEAERLVAAGELVFVDVTARWCVTCRVNEQLVLETPEIAEIFARHEVIPMKADWTNRSAEIADYLADHGRYAIPFYVLYRPGDEPFLFSELLNKEVVISTVSSAAEKLAGYREELQRHSAATESADGKETLPSAASPD